MSSSEAIWVRIHQLVEMFCVLVVSLCTDHIAGLGFSTSQVRWSRLSEQIFRVDKWSLCRGVRLPRGRAAG